MNKYLMVVRFATTALALAASATMAADSGEGTLIERINGSIDDRSIEGLLVDNAAGTISATTLAGIDGGSVDVVENVRDFSLLVNALDPNAKGFGLSVTPARTKFPVPAISLVEYGRPDAHLNRLIASITVSYAQGKVDVSGVDYTNRAFAIGTSGFWKAQDDPVVAVANAKECKDAAFDAIPDEPPSRPQSEVDELVRLTRLEAAAAGGDVQAKGQVEEILTNAAAGDQQAKKQREVIDDAKMARLAKDGDQKAKNALAKKIRNAQRFSGDVERAALEAFSACAEIVLKKQSEKWNRTRYSVSLAAGSTRPSDRSGSGTSLGKTLAASVLYGFDGIEALRDRAAITFTARYSRSEPVLDTLGTSTVKFKNSNLAALRLSGGSSIFRGLIEVSNARASDVTTSQRDFRRALGIDYRVMDGLWLNVRYGKQRKVEGGGDETGSFLILNYSPGAKLNF